MQGELKCALTCKETRCLSLELANCLQNGYQNTLTWKTREQLLKIVTDFVGLGVTADLEAVTKEGLIFILNLIPEKSMEYMDGEKVFKSIRKRAYKAIEMKTRKYYNI